MKCLGAFENVLQSPASARNVPIVADAPNGGTVNHCDAMAPSPSSPTTRSMAQWDVKGGVMACLLDGRCESPSMVICLSGT